eukprot:4139482-Amphidinium_carterae.1
MAKAVGVHIVKLRRHSGQPRVRKALNRIKNTVIRLICQCGNACHQAKGACHPSYMTTNNAGRGMFVKLIILDASTGVQEFETNVKTMSTCYMTVPAVTQM